MAVGVAVQAVEDGASYAAGNEPDDVRAVTDACALSWYMGEVSFYTARTSTVPSCRAEERVLGRNRGAFVLTSWRA